MIALGTRAVSAIAGMIPRVAKSAPGAYNAALTRMRGLGAQFGNKVDDVVAWARRNPGNAAIAAVSMASVGITMSDFTEGDVSEEVSATLRDVEAGNLTPAEALRITNAGRSSESLNLNIAENRSDMAITQQVLRWAKGHYGSVNASVHAHRMQQAFFEMPLDDVETGFQLLRV